MHKPRTIDEKRCISVIMPCFRDSQRAITLARKLREQYLPGGWSLEILIVDDGSGKPEAEQLDALASHVATVVLLPENVGRTLARIAGIDRAGGELLLMIDADCLPANQHLLAAHIEALSDADVVLSVGPVQGHDQRFWSRYQSSVMTQRVRRTPKIPGIVGSSANACVRRQAYLDIGGLDCSYSGYGFEDRDLFLRLASLGRVRWTPTAAVEHLDELSLPDVCRKLAESGSSSSGHFAKRHPAAYRALGYARFDARGRSALAFAGRLLDPWIPRLAGWLDPMLDRIPFLLARYLVKALSALAFLAGTSRATTTEGADAGSPAEPPRHHSRKEGAR